METQKTLEKKKKKHKEKEKLHVNEFNMYICFFIIILEIFTKLAQDLVVEMGTGRFCCVESR